MRGRDRTAAQRVFRRLDAEEIRPYPGLQAVATGRQNELFMQRLAAANYLERPSSCGSLALQIGGPILPQGR
jgi:hypothetical protein